MNGPSGGMKERVFASQYVPRRTQLCKDAPSSGHFGGDGHGDVWDAGEAGVDEDLAADDGVDEVRRVGV